MSTFPNGEAVNQTLLGLALDSGFNSKATFNRAFKKFAGHSPADHLKRLEAESGVKS